MPDNFNQYHWAYTLGFEVVVGECDFRPGVNGYKSLDSFDARALAHYRYGLKRGRAELRESRK